MLVAVSPHTRVSRHKEHAEQARCVHCVIISRVHMRTVAVAAEQPAGGPRRDQAPRPQPLALQLRLKSKIHAGMLFSSLLYYHHQQPIEIHYWF